MSSLGKMGKPFSRLSSAVNKGAGKSKKPIIAGQGFCEDEGEGEEEGEDEDEDSAALSCDSASLPCVAELSVAALSDAPAFLAF